MKQTSAIRHFFRVRPFTAGRFAFALALAVAADAAQLLFGVLGWALTDQLIDLGTMVLTVGALGFHPLLLPTFAAEFIPGIDLFPSWTACVVTVGILRRKTAALSAMSNSPAPQTDRDVSIPRRPPIA